MNHLPPFTTVYTTVFTKMRLKTTRARLLALFVFSALLSTAAFSAASAGSVRQLLFGKRAEATPAAGNSASLSRLSLSLPAAQTPTDGSLNIARRGHSATLLSDGKVLIVGGENQSGFVTEAEIFDPATGSFSISGNLNTPRADHSASRLADGRVLIAGGRGALGALNSTEIFDPASGAFTSGPDLNSARSGQTATVLADGRVVLAGGDAGSVEIYDPAPNAFSATGINLSTPRAFHGAALLNDGRILIAGGTAPDDSDVQSGEIVDITNGTVEAVANATEDEHVRPTMRVLPDGKVQIIGGTAHEAIEIYDPAINQFGAHAHVFPIGDSHPNLLDEIMASPTRAAMFRLGASSALLNREGQTITELPGTNQALVAGGADSTDTFLNSTSVLNSSPASITTDKLDYAPGTPVIVSGSGFQPNEVVTLMFHEDPHIDTENPHTFTVQADANGNFSCQDYAPEDEDAGVTYILAARAGTSGWTAQTALTDAPATRKYSASITPTGSASSYTLRITNDATSTIELGKATITIPSGFTSPSLGTVTVSGGKTWAASLSGSVITLSASGCGTSGGGPNAINAGEYVEVIVNVTPPACVSGSTNNYTWVTSASQRCDSGSGNDFTLVGSDPVVTIGPTCLAPTTLTVSAAVGTYGGTVNLSATLTKTSDSSAVSGESISFTLNGISVGSASTNGSGVATLSSVSLTGINAGTYNPPSNGVSASFAGDSSFGASNGSNTLTVNKATVTVTASSPTVTYGDAVPGITPGYSGFVNGENESVLDTAPTCTTTYTDGSPASPPTYPTSCSGGADGNYDFSYVAGAVTVNKANANCSSVTGYTLVYDGNPHTATGSCLGVDGETLTGLDLTGTTHTNAGVYNDTWTFTDVTGNYNNQGPTSVTDTINKRPTTLVLDTTGHNFINFDCINNKIKVTLTDT
ncbi:MAG TPA: kelch repeat-containing protein, partial [Pyrinomonadaceae bacterium]|nr:kelch repeat-containing protein [Pyrinomonadaceae bacterium]